MELGSITGVVSGILIINLFYSNFSTSTGSCFINGKICSCSLLTMIFFFSFNYFSGRVVLLDKQNKTKHWKMEAVGSENI